MEIIKKASYKNLDILITRIEHQHVEIILSVPKPVEPPKEENKQVETKNVNFTALNGHGISFGITIKKSY